jgi:hypothetical protein
LGGWIPAKPKNDDAMERLHWDGSFMGSRLDHVGSSEVELVEGSTTVVSRDTPAPSVGINRPEQSKVRVLTMTE